MIVRLTWLMRLIAGLGVLLALNLLVAAPPAVGEHEEGHVGGDTGEEGEHDEDDGGSGDEDDGGSDWVDPCESRDYFSGPFPEASDNELADTSFPYRFNLGVIIRDYIGEPPSENAQLMIAYCAVDADYCPGTTITTGAVYGDGDYVLCASWVGGDEVVPTVDDLVPDLLAEIDENLPAPDVDVFPEAGAPIIVHVPMMIHVANFEDPQSYENCDPSGALCLRAIVTPDRWEFYSGEPLFDGGPALVCDGPGIPFDPDGPSVEEQARFDGACAHEYEQRTDKWGRPPEWEGEVQMHWTITWEVYVGNGEPPEDDVTSTSTPISREVDEVSAIVVD